MITHGSDARAQLDQGVSVDMRMEDGSATAGIESGR